MPSGSMLTDLFSEPWSHRGSYMAVSELTRGRPDPWDCPPGRNVESGIYLHDVSGGRFWKWNGVFRFEAPETGGASEHVRFRSATPALLNLSCGGGTIELTWDGPDTIRIRGKGNGLRLRVTSTDELGSVLAFPRDDRSWRFHMGPAPHYLVECLTGSVQVAAQRARTIEHSHGSESEQPVIDIVPGPGDSFEVALVQYQSETKASREHRPFDACVREVENDFTQWLTTQPPAPKEYSASAARAVYVMWASIVKPRAVLRRPAMLMSKNWMHAVWSWDHCFNAIGLSTVDPGLSWDQYMLPFDMQGPTGALPDVVHDGGVMFGFVKPPVHGWTLARLVRAGVPTVEQLSEVYPQLCRWTTWYLDYRDDNRDGLCEYFHACDSGLDNASCFDMGLPATGPDLAAYLILQMHTLADVAAKLGVESDAFTWRKRAQSMLAELIDRLWDGERFLVENAGTGRVNERSASILPYVPMILGNLLPASIREKLVARFRSSGLLSSAGPATESPESDCYEADGYWRGPVWAPTTLLIVDGLVACGEHDLAQEVATRFLNTCRTSGFAENYEATTGRPLRDPAYTWSASVFLSLTNLSIQERPAVSLED